MYHLLLSVRLKHFRMLKVIMVIQRYQIKQCLEITPNFLHDFFFFIVVAQIKYKKVVDSQV